MNPQSFTALDFETATSENNSICQIGLVVVNNGIITKKYESLVQPPENEYTYHNIKVHKIEPFMTQNISDFSEIWPEIEIYINKQHLVCHNAKFDLSKLEGTLSYYNLPIPTYTYNCTLELLGDNLRNCCEEYEIELNNHHDALADAEACAKLYLKFMEGKGEIELQEDFIPFGSKKVEKDDLKPNFDIENKSNPFYRKKIVFTGDLLAFRRKEAAHKIKLLGADVNTSISKKTDFVIIGNNPGPSKMIKIEKLGIPIISEDEFLKMLEE
jgi:DNA polymerase-3 subunit epsilon